MVGSDFARSGVDAGLVAGGVGAEEGQLDAQLDAQKIAWSFVSFVSSVMVYMLARAPEPLPVDPALEMRAMSVHGCCSW